MVADIIPGVKEMITTDSELNTIQQKFKEIQNSTFNSLGKSSGGSRVA